jgi:phospholipase/lecithinase/hemolysin
MALHGFMFLGHAPRYLVDALAARIVQLPRDFVPQVRGIISFGQNYTYIRCMYVVSGRKITKYTVIYGVIIRSVQP